jgi:DNA mismatch repair protein MutH
MAHDRLPLAALADNYDPRDPESIERYAKRLIGRTLREALERDKGLQPSPGKGSFGRDLETLYFGLPACSESRPDFALAGLELKSSPLKRIDKGKRLVPKERVALSMIDYAGILQEEWATSAFLKKNRHILFVFYEHDNDAASPLDCIIKCVGRWTIPDECIPALEEEWLLIQRLLRGYGEGALHGSLTNNLEAFKKGAKGATAHRAFAFKVAFVKKYILPRLSWTQPILPAHYDDADLAVLSERITELFQPYFGRTADEIAASLDLRTNGRSKAHHAAVTKAILGIDPDNAIEDVNVRTIRLESGKDKPRESISFPAFKYMDLIEQSWKESDLRSILLKPFLFVVFQEETPGGRRVLSAVKLWRMPEADLEGEVRRTWEETVRRIRDGRADQLPKMSESRICHVRPHGRDSRDTLLTPMNGPQVKRCFWLGRDYVGEAISA